MSALIPFIAYALVFLFSGLDRLNSAAISGHYGSISVVTFVAAIARLESRGIEYGGYMVAVASIMEVPAIITALWLANRKRS